MMKAFIVLFSLAAAALAAPTINNQEVVEHNKVSSGQQVMSDEQLGQLMQLTKMIPQTETDQIKQQALQMALGVLNKKQADGDNNTIVGDNGDDGETEDGDDGDSAPSVGSSDDVVTTLTDIVNTLTSINGMNDVGVDNTDVVNTATGIGNVDVMVGSSGDTVRTEIGDLVNVIGAIQGHWYNFDIANVNVEIE